MGIYKLLRNGVRAYLGCQQTQHCCTGHIFYDGYGVLLGCTLRREQGSVMNVPGNPGVIFSDPYPYLTRKVERYMQTQRSMLPWPVVTDSVRYWQNRPCQCTDNIN